MDAGSTGVPDALPAALRRLALLPLIGLVGCAPVVDVQSLDDDVRVRRVPIIQLSGSGLSGTAADEQDRLWAIAERQPLLVLFDQPGAEAPRVVRRLVRGVPEGLETESLAWLGHGRLLAGTESRVPNRRSDALLLLELEPDAARVTEMFTVDYEQLFGVHAAANQGLEGLCYAGGVALAAAETSILRDEQRLSPLVRVDLTTRTVVPFWLALTSSTGKVSALDCRRSDDPHVLDVLAIERHYGITRVLQFFLPLSGVGFVLTPRVALDAGVRFRPHPNVEGITRHGAGLVLVTDHDSPRIPGSTERIVLDGLGGAGLERYAND